MFVMEKVPTFHCRCLSFLSPEWDPHGVVVPRSPALCPLSAIRWQASCVDCGLILATLCTPRSLLCLINAWQGSAEWQFASVEYLPVTTWDGLGSLLGEGPQVWVR
jgi:hypothetical protein